MKTLKIMETIEDLQEFVHELKFHAHRLGMDPSGGAAMLPATNELLVDIRDKIGHSSAVYRNMNTDFTEVQISGYVLWLYDIERFVMTYKDLKEGIDAIKKKDSEDKKRNKKK